MNKEFLPSAYDTSDSFYPSPQFSYHNKKADYECRIMLQNKEKAINRILQQQPIKKEQLQELISYLQKDTDLMINELLTEATQLRQKLKAQKNTYETNMRELKSKIRSLAEENIKIVSDMQLKERIHKEEINQLRKSKKGNLLQKSTLDKEIEGMQKLLNQYQSQMQRKQREIQLLKKEIEEKAIYYQTAKSQILDQTTQIQGLKQQVYLLQREYKTQQLINSTQKSNQINLLMQKDVVFDTQINDREYLINLMSEEASKKQKQIDSLMETVKKLNQLLQNEKKNKKVQKNNQRNAILKLQNATQTAIAQIKEKYSNKMQKVAELLRKELRKLKKQLQIFKVAATKQIQLCQKQTKGILISQLKAFYSN